MPTPTGENSENFFVGVFGFGIVELAPIGATVYNPRLEPGESDLQRLLTPTGRYYAARVTPRWGYKIRGDTTPG